MAREHITVRLSTDVLRGVESWAKEHGVTRSTAVDELCKAALTTRAEAVKETEETSGVIAAMQAHIDTLTKQMEVKDAQIGTLTQLADQAQRLHAASTALPASVTESGQDMEQGATADQDGQGRKRGFWASLWS